MRDPPPKKLFWGSMGEIKRGNTEGIPKKPHSLDAPPQGRGWRIWISVQVFVAKHFSPQAPIVGRLGRPTIGAWNDRPNWEILKQNEPYHFLDVSYFAVF